MFAVHTKRTLSGRGFGDSLALRLLAGASHLDHGGVGQVEVVGVAKAGDHVVEGVLDAAAGGVDADVRVGRLLVRRGDAGELGDLTAPGLGVEALAVAPLALLERGGDVHEEERAARRVGHRPDLLPGLVERRDRAADRDPAVPGDLGGDPPDPADVGLAVLLGEGQAGGQVPAYDVAVEAGHRARALLEDPVHQRPGQRRLAAAGQPGEEQHQAPLVGAALVEVHDVRDLRRELPVGGQADDPVVAGVVGDHLHAERVVGVGVTVRRQRYGDHGGVGQHRGRRQRRPQQADRRERRRAVADQREQGDRAEAVELGQLGVGERVGHGDERAAGVPLPGLRRREVEPPERAVLGVGQGLHLPAVLRVGAHHGERQPLGVDQLDGARFDQLRRQLTG